MQPGWRSVGNVRIESVSTGIKGSEKGPLGWVPSGLKRYFGDSGVGPTPDAIFSNFG